VASWNLTRFNGYMKHLTATYNVQQTPTRKHVYWWSRLSAFE
jgi:hypothetical protein